MSYSADYTKVARQHPLDRDPYDYHVTYTTQSHRDRRRNLDLDRDVHYYPQEPQHVPGLGRPATNLDHIGDYVAHQLVPVVLSRSDLPLQLVMNFGNLHLDGDAQEYGPRKATTAATGTNAIIYNAPGATMTLGSARQRSSLDYDAPRTSTHGKKVGICYGCDKRQLVGATGYCWDCDLGGRQAITSGADRAGGMGIPYVKTSEWLNSDREQREVEREREREWQRKYVRGCYGDVERQDIHRYQYTRNSW